MGFIFVVSRYLGKVGTSPFPQNSRAAHPRVIRLASKQAKASTPSAPTVEVELGISSYMF